MWPGYERLAEPRVLVQDLVLDETRLRPANTRPNAVFEEIRLPDDFVVRQNGGSVTIVDRDGSTYNGYARVAEVTFSNGTRENAGVIQLVPNANTGGRAGQLFNRQGLNDNNYNQLSDRTQSLRFQQVVGPINAPPQNIAANIFFQVQGTNRSLNQRVVFTGNLIQNGTVLNTLNNGGNYTTINNTIPNTQNTQATQQSPASLGDLQGNFSNGRNSPNTYNNFINGRVQLDNKQPTELNALQVDP